jgi:dGTP triphosphohydrolase
MTATNEATKTGSVSLQGDFDQAATAAKNAVNYLPQLREELAMSNQPRAEGFFAPLEGFANAFAEEMGMSPDQATRDQLLKSGATKRVMEWFQNSGLGARGMDTPAEFERFLQAMGGSEKMTNEAYAKLLQRYIAEEERKIKDYNAMLTDNRYQDVYNRGNATRYEIPSNQQSNLPAGFVED